MSKGSVRVSAALSFPAVLLAFVLACPSCGGGGGGAPASAQGDLAGRWDVIELDTGAVSGWARLDVTIDGAGNVFVNTYVDSLGTSLPGPPPWDIDTRYATDGSGTVREYDASVLSPSMYGSLSSKKNLLVVTDNGDPGSYSLSVSRKRDAAVAFGDGDIRGKAFAYHQLYGGTDNVWEYGFGSIGSLGQVTLDNATRPNGEAGGYPLADFITLAVDAGGFVTSADNSFHGWLTNDKSTLIGIIDVPGGDSADRLVAIQFLGQAHMQADLAGRWRWHVLFAPGAAGWVKGAWTIGPAGDATYDNSVYLTDTGATTPPSVPETLTLYPDGTIRSSSLLPYHGMLSGGDEDLWVRVKTHTNPARYSISFSVR